MDLQQNNTKAWHLSLGPIERWIAALVGAFFIAGVYWFAGKVDKQGDQIQTLVTQQAVANGSLSTISSQLTDIPQLRRDVVEMKVRVDALEESQRELRQMRGLR